MCDVVPCCIVYCSLQCDADGSGFCITDFHAWAQGFGAMEDFMGGVVSQSE